MIRLQKALAERGVASRRRAEELITEGRVRVDGEVARTLGTKVRPDARIDVDGIPTEKAMARYVLLNKPKGVVSTAHDERGRQTVVDLIGARERIYPVGRLDTDSEGMVLLTNDGDWAERVLHPRYGHEREYDVSVVGDLTAEATAQLRNGVRLEEGLAVAARMEVRSRSRAASRLRVVLHTGWRRQIRRMLAAVGLRTARLVRVRIGNLPLGKLRAGDWRELTPAEIADLARPAEHPRVPRPASTSAGPGASASAAAKRPLQRAMGRPVASRREGFGAAASVPRPRPRAQRSMGGERRPSPGRGSHSMRSRPSRPPTGRTRAPSRPTFALRPGPRRPVPRYGTSRGPVRARVAPR